MSTKDHILTLSCPDKPGIVHTVTGVFAQHNLNILDLQQFSDPELNKFFMRVHFGHIDQTDVLVQPLSELQEDLQMNYEIVATSHKPKVLIMVSKIGHCLNDLLFRQKMKLLNIEVPAIVSNHPDFESLAKSYDIPFYHLPVNKDTKTEQESRILELVKEYNVDLIVLARYMQAYDRGVKIMGATAHFVTADLDEGPIIEQRITRVDHSMQPQELVEEGSNVETQTLAAAVKWWSEKKVFLNGTKTVVFN